MKRNRLINPFTVTVVICWSTVAIASEQNQPPPQTLKDEREQRELIIERELAELADADDEAKPSFFRVWNFSKNAERIDVFLKSNKEVIAIGRNLRMGIPLPFRKIPEGEYTLFVTESGVARLTEENFDDPLPEPPPPDQLQKIIEPLSIKLEANACSSLLLSDQNGSLNFELISSEAGKGKTATTARLALFVFSEQNLDRVKLGAENIPIDRFELQNGWGEVVFQQPDAQQEVTVAFTNSKGRSRQRSRVLDYEYGHDFSVFFIEDHYGKTKLLSVENGLRAAVYDTVHEK